MTGREGGSACWGLALSAHRGGELSKGIERASGFFLCRSPPLFSMKEGEGVVDLDTVACVCGSLGM